ncbi:uncharacterized protein [Antedon mediterranea]|uniref:uncharacterized protein n=1 Tax=Antedon mediterranea TaxID=105859 RepID=UPI003AF5D4B9
MNEVPDGIKDRMCAQKVTSKIDHTIIAISWHGRQNSPSNDMKKSDFVQLMEFAKKNKQPADHLVIGGNFNITSDEAQDWLKDSKDFVVAATDPKGCRKGKKNLDYFIVSSSDELKVTLNSLDVNKMLKVTVPKMDIKLAYDQRHLLKLISDLNLDEFKHIKTSQEKPTESVCKKLHLPDVLLQAATDLEKAKDAETGNDENKCGKKHLLKVITEADHDTILAFSEILENSM